MSLVKVDGAEWRWVHGLVIPIDKSILRKIVGCYQNRELLQTFLSSTTT